MHDAFFEYSLVDSKGTLVNKWSQRPPIPVSQWLPNQVVKIPSRIELPSTKSGRYMVRVKLVDAVRHAAVKLPLEGGDSALNYTLFTIIVDAKGNLDLKEVGR